MEESGAPTAGTSRVTPPPRIRGIRVISGLFIGQNTDGDRPGAHGVNSLSG